MSLPISGIRPSWKSGFARSAGESANPSLWKGLVGAWVPALGNTGIATLRDVSGRRNHGTIVNMEAADWKIDSSGQYLAYGGTDEYSTAPIPGLLNVFTVFAKAKANDVTNALYILSINDSSDTDRQYALIFQGNVAGDPIRFRERYDGPFYNGSSVQSYQADTWYSITGIRSSPTSRTVYVDGITGSTDTTSLSHPDIDTVDIGRLGDSTPSQSAVDVAVVLLWERVLSISEIAIINANPLAPFRLKPLTIATGGAAPAGGFQSAWASGSNRIIQ